jgi:hypothetical protein
LPEYHHINSRYAEEYSKEGIKNGKVGIKSGTETMAEKAFADPE